MLEFLIEVLDLKNNRNVNLVWFDSKLQDLMLPVLSRPNYVKDADEMYYESISVSKMTEKYFEWVGNVSARERNRVRDSGICVLSRKSLGEDSRLEVRVSGPGDAEMFWEWLDHEAVLGTHE